MAPLILSYSQMVDMALCSNKFDMFHSNVLRTVLHCLITQLELKQTRFEYHGPNRELMIKQILKPDSLPSTINLKQSKIEGEADQYENWVRTSIEENPDEDNFVKLLIDIDEEEPDDEDEEQVPQEDTQIKEIKLNLNNLTQKTETMEKEMHKLLKSIGELNQHQNDFRASQILPVETLEMDSNDLHSLKPTLPMVNIPNGLINANSVEGNESTPAYGNILKTDSGSVAQLYYQPGIAKTVIKEEILSELLTYFENFNKCVIESNFKLLEKEFIGKMHRLKEVIYERCALSECEYCKTQKEIKRINDHVEDLFDLTERHTKQLKLIEQNEKEINCKIEDIMRKVSCLLAEKEMRRRQITVIMESIEQVKTIKANHEELDAMASIKADKVVVHTKVPYDKFNIIRHDLSCSITDAIQKYIYLYHTLDIRVKEIKVLIEEKLNIIENVKLREYVETQFKALNKKLDLMIDTRICPESCGTIRYLKDVRCITCGDNVSMKMSETENIVQSLPKLTSTLCKQTTRTNAKLVALVHKREKNDVVRSRYCGGENTLTQPLDKVPRKTNFFDDFNICPPSSLTSNSYAEGTDGVLYRTDPPKCSKSK